ncbi:cytochrome P450 [Sphaerosporella brunnea]|uniref:Cytochrome P450 n=1 Tax=Sphaerosporella brunnea TaxID=1250544 RepID=A0A5J5FA74_9PEZI|nr:cytochrome P450 [Sphaerosporella brunnea]
MSLFEQSIRVSAHQAWTFVASHPKLSVVGVCILLQIARWIYLLFFHPLARFPGPKIAAISELWYAYVYASGQSVWVLDEAHKKYGPVVRTSPNSLSFATSASIRDIYRQKNFLKASSFDDIDAVFEVPGLGTDKDPESHAKQRKLSNPAFTTSAVREYEPLINEYLDPFLKAIEERGKDVQGVNMEEWFKYLIFDTAGALSTGESFDALKGGVPHRWMKMVTGLLDMAAYHTVLSRITGIKFLLSLITPHLMVEERKFHTDWIKDHVNRRIASPSDRKDFLHHFIEKDGSTTCSVEQLYAHTSHFLPGTTETTAIVILATFYHLLKTPAAWHQLQEEIRRAFTSVEDINSTALSALPYLNAVLREGLRIMPGFSNGFPRYSPGAVVSGHFVPKGTVVSTHHWTVVHDETNFEAPYEFRPERWIDPNNGDTKEASQPFGLGSRNCIGQNLAWVLMRLYLAKTIFLYDLELVDPKQDWMRESKSYFLWIKAPLMVRVSRRNGV